MQTISRFIEAPTKFKMIGVCRLIFSLTETSQLNVGKTDLYLSVTPKQNEYHFSITE